jgi:hypothetical protein
MKVQVLFLFCLAGTALSVSFYETFTEEWGAWKLLHGSFIMIYNQMNSLIIFPFDSRKKLFFLCGREISDEDFLGEQS